MIKEIEFKFDDGGYYIVRADNSGDSICGPHAHKLMYEMGKYNPPIDKNFHKKVECIIFKSIITGIK